MCNKKVKQKSATALQLKEKNLQYYWIQMNRYPGLNVNLALQSTKKNHILLAEI